jgi:hypothetical protein
MGHIYTNPLRAPLAQRIFIGILEDFLNEFSPHSFFSSKIPSIQKNSTFLTSGVNKKFS